MAMALLNKMRKQQGVYWAPTGFSGNGQRTYATGVQMRIRWQDETKEIQDATGARTLSTAKVFTGEDVLVGGVFMLGTLADVTDDSSPLENEGAYKIKRFDKLPTLKADDNLRTVYL